MRRPARSNGSARRTRPCRPAAGIARTPTRRKRRSPTVSALRLVRPERRSVLLLARWHAALEEAVAAAADLSRLRHRVVAVVHDGRVYLLHDSEASRLITALDAQDRRRSCGARRGHDRLSEIVLVDAVRVEERAADRDRDDRARRWSCSYDIDGKELWRIAGMSMPTASPMRPTACSSSAPARRVTRTGRSSRCGPARPATSR